MRLAAAFTNIPRNYASISGQNGQFPVKISFTRFKNDLLANLIHLNDSTDTAFLWKLT